MTKTPNLNGVEEEEVSSDSIDEGVYVESSESSSPSVSSPTSSAASRAASLGEHDQASKVDTDQQVSIHPSTNVANPNTFSNQSDQTNQPKPKTKSKSLSASFLSSFFLLSSLRAISRRSMRRKTPKSFSNNKNSSTKAEFSLEESTTSQAQSRPTSSSSSYSSSNSSSAFSSNSSISSSQQSSSTNSSTSGSFTLPDELRVEAQHDGQFVNGVYSNLITESIIEEDEEEEENETQGADKLRKDLQITNKMCNSGSHNQSSTLPVGQQFSNSQTMPRSVASSYVLSSMCPHNHFSIYGPVLCSNALAQNNQTIEATPSAALLRYCVRMYLPLPYYDIRFDQKFSVTCRVLLIPSKGEKEKLLVNLPEQYKNQEFTARGNGETLRIARNMAAQTIIDKLKKASIYQE